MEFRIRDSYPVPGLWAVLSFACTLAVLATGLYAEEKSPGFFDPVTHGSQISDRNTGVPPGHELIEVRSVILVTDAWVRDSNGGRRVLENRHFLPGSRLIVAVNGFTVRYCKFSGSAGFSTFANYSDIPLGRNVRIEYCEFDGNHENRAGSVAVDGSSLTLKRVHIHRWPRAMWVGDGDVSVEECYMHDLTCDGSGAHIENIYVGGGAHQVYARNKLISNAVLVSADSKEMISASLAIYNESYDRGKPFASFPELADIKVVDNYFESDGHYALYAGAVALKLPKPFARGMVVSGNVFGRQLHRFCGISGAAVAFDGNGRGNAWTDNRWGPRGAGWQPGDPEEGQAVPAPGPF